MSSAFSVAAQENGAASAVREQVFEGWTLRCVAPAGVSDEQGGKVSACEISESITVRQDDGSALEVLKLAISPAANKAGKAGWALVVLFPLDVLLSADFGLETRARRSPVSIATAIAIISVVSAWCRWTVPWRTAYRKPLMVRSISGSAIARP
jgi:invasion protein IalB